MSSKYHLNCGACGAVIISKEPTGKCTNCGVGFEVQWQAPVAPQPEPPPSAIPEPTPTEAPAAPAKPKAFKPIGWRPS